MDTEHSTTNGVSKPRLAGFARGRKTAALANGETAEPSEAPVKRGRGKTTLVIKPPKTSTPRPDKVEIFSIERDVFKCRITGLSDLIVNNFNEKSVQEMEDQRRLDGEGKRAEKREDRPPVIPEERYALARILDDEGRDCVPARYIKASMITAARRYGEAGISTTALLGSLYVRGDLLPIEYEGVKPWPGLLPYLTKPYPKQVPMMRRDVCRVGRPGMKQPDLRYRPAFHNWSLDIEVEYEPNLLSLKALHQLIRRAGSSIGLCEWRPEGPGGEKRGGDFGRFDIGSVRATRRGA
jgi:hypothetical protein